MKKVTVLFLCSILFSGSALALTPQEEKQARYLEVKKIKDAQRARRELEKNNPEIAAKKEKTFWQKEGERSGLAGNGSRMNSFFKNLNPVPFFKSQQEKYNARKAAAGVSDANAAVTGASVPAAS
jgi:hypothetical protein